MIRKEKHVITCPQPECKTSFPIVTMVDTENLTGSKTREVRCPACQTLLTLDVPDGISGNDTVFRGGKDAH